MGELLGGVPDHGQVVVSLAGKVVVEQPFGDTGFLGDVVGGNVVVPKEGEDGFAQVEQALSTLLDSEPFRRFSSHETITPIY